MVSKLSTLVPAVGAFLLACPALSQSVVRVADLDFAAPEPDLDRVIWLNTRVGPSLVPRVAVEGVPALLGLPEGINGINHGALLDVDVALRGELPDGPLRGTFFLSDPDGSAWPRTRFVIHPSDVEVDAGRHRAAIAAHYDMLAGTDLPGAPWFRRQAMANGPISPARASGGCAPTTSGRRLRRSSPAAAPWPRTSASTT